jgi:ATP-binding protein involved in chromosome partitioning
VKKIRVDGDSVNVDLQLGYPAKSQHEVLETPGARRGRRAAGRGARPRQPSQKTTSHAVQRGVKLIPGVKNIVAVASGKGGVGKSTPP